MRFRLDRIEHGENVDVFALFDEIAADAERLSRTTVARPS